MAVLTAPSTVQWSPNPELIRMMSAGNPIGNILAGLSNSLGNYGAGETANINLQRNINADVLNGIKAEAAAEQAHAESQNFFEKAREQKMLNDAGLPVQEKNALIDLHKAQTKETSTRATGLELLNKDLIRTQAIQQEKDYLQQLLANLEPGDYTNVMNAFADPANQAAAVDFLMKKTGYKKKFLNDRDIQTLVSGGMLSADTKGYDTVINLYQQLEKRGIKQYEESDPVSGLSGKDFTGENDEITGIKSVLKNLGLDADNVNKAAEKFRLNMPYILSEGIAMLPDAAKALPRTVIAKIIASSIRSTTGDRLPQWAKFANGEARIGEDLVIDKNQLENAASVALQQYQTHGADYERWKETGEGRMQIQSMIAELGQRKVRESAYARDEQTGAYRRPQTPQEILQQNIGRLPKIKGLSDKQSQAYYAALVQSAMFGSQVPKISDFKQMTFPDDTPGNDTEKKTETSSNVKAPSISPEEAISFDQYELPVDEKDIKAFSPQQKKQILEQTPPFGSKLHDSVRQSLNEDHQKEFQQLAEKGQKDSFTEADVTKLANILKEGMLSIEYVQLFTLYNNKLRQKLANAKTKEEQQKTLKQLRQLENASSSSLSF